MTIAEFFMIRPHGPNCWTGLGAFSDRVLLLESDDDVIIPTIPLLRRHGVPVIRFHMVFECALRLTRPTHVHGTGQQNRVHDDGRTDGRMDRQTSSKLAREHSRTATLMHYLLERVRNEHR
uniref:Uncharacterized protein n=1 Tax=Sipha flava TaxID=143950 RepID=A0A2S2QYB7_9HEMI